MEVNLFGGHPDLSASIQGGKIQVRLFGLPDFTSPLIPLIIRACMNFINLQFQLWNKNILIKVCSRWKIFLIKIKMARFQ